MDKRFPTLNAMRGAHFTLNHCRPLKQVVAATRPPPASGTTSERLSVDEVLSSAAAAAANAATRAISQSVIGSGSVNKLVVACVRITVTMRWLSVAAMVVALLAVAVQAQFGFMNGFNGFFRSMNSGFRTMFRPVQSMFSPPSRPFSPNVPYPVQFMIPNPTSFLPSFLPWLPVYLSLKENPQSPFSQSELQPRRNDGRR